MGAALVITAALLALGPLGNVNLDAGVHTASNLRLISEREQPGQPGQWQERDLAEFGLTPRLTLMNDARLRLALSYAPTLRVPYESAAPGTGEDELSTPLDHTTLLHDVQLLAERELGRWSLRSSARASYGTFDPSARSVTPVQPLLSASQIPYQAYVLGAGFTTLPARRVSIAVDALASMSGGRGSQAEQTLPLQRELRLDGVFDYDATRRTSYAALLSLAAARIDRSGDAALVRAGGRWTWSMTRRHSLRLSAGAVTAFERAAPGAPAREGASSTFNTGPWAQASLGYTPGKLRPSLALTVGAEPAIDRLSGAVDYRGYLEAGLAWSPLRDWQFGLSGYGAVLEPWLGNEIRQATRTWLTELRLRAGRSFGRYVTVGAALSSTWQDSGRIDLASFRELAALLELTAAMPP